MAGAASAALLTACGNSGTNGAAATNSDGSKQIAGGQPAAESPNIKWAQGLSGNILVTLAKKHGYFEDNGLSVEEIPLDPGGLQGVVQGTVDIASNWGTGTPLQMIANGELGATVLQDGEGQIQAGIDVMLSVINGEKVDAHQKVMVPFVLVTKENVADYQ